MYISISRYDGAAGKIGEAAPKAQQGLIPMLKNQKGFLGYAAFASEQGDIVVLHIWDTGQALESARPKIREWVGGHPRNSWSRRSASPARLDRTPSCLPRVAARANPSTASYGR